MKIKISRAWSLNIFAIILMLFAPILLVVILVWGLVWDFFTLTFLIAAILFLVGIAMKKKNVFVIFRSYDLTNELTKNTLNLLKLSYGQENDILTLDKTGTKIKIVKVGFVSVMILNFIDLNSLKEKYITDTLVKYQN